MDDPTMSGTPNLRIPAPGATSAVQASITVGGDLSGQIAIGNNIVQMRIGEVHGNVVLPAEKRPRVERRQAPLRLLPRRPAAFLDRDAETSRTSAVLADGLNVSFYAGPGVGKSSLLRHLAFQPFIASSGGVAHASVRGQPRDDILQYLFDLCYDTDGPYKPTRGQLRHYLQSVDCTLLLDDLDLDADDVADVLDFTPGSRFVFSSTRPVHLDGVQSLPLAGLPAEHAVGVLTAALGRPLQLQERGAATALSAAVDGVPRRLVQTAAAVRDGRMTMGAAARTPPELWTEVAARDEPDRRLLAALSALPALRLGMDDLRLVSGVDDADGRLTDLAAAGLVQMSAAGAEVGYEVVSGVPESLPVPAVTEARRHLRDHLIAWAGTRPADETSTLRVVAALELLKASAAAQEWGDALVLGRAIDPALALSGRWDAWRQELSKQLTAARALPDQAAEAYALHQLGTRALCLGEAAEARGLLVEALRLRELHGDRAGAEVTRNNLALLPVPPPTSGGAGIDRAPRWRASARDSLLAAPLVVKALLILLLLLTVTAATATLRGWSDPASTSTVDLTPARLSFPAQMINTASEPLAVAVGNPGDEPLQIGAVQVTGPHDGDFSVAPGGCAEATLPAGGGCRVSVTFIPTASGVRQATLTLAQAGSEDPGVVPLTGTGAEGPDGAVTAAPTQLSFPAQPVRTTSDPQTVTIENLADVPVQVGDLLVTGTDAGDFQVAAENCRQAGLAADARCQIQVIFLPSATGIRTATLTLGIPRPRPDLVIPLSGTGRSVEPRPDPTVTAPEADPTLTVPETVVIEAAGPDGASVTYQAAATDAAGRPLTASCTPASGSVFAIGTRTVGCTATDAAGRRATATFPVTVRDTQPPQLQLPDDLVIEATDPYGAAVEYPDITATDLVSGAADVACRPSSGGVFKLGDNDVSCSATDAAGNTAREAFSVHVVDTTPPKLIVLADITAYGSGEGAIVNYAGPTATDTVDGTVTPHCNHPSGSRFPLGDTDVTCTASDKRGNKAHGTFKVTVEYAVE